MLRQTRPVPIGRRGRGQTDGEERTRPARTLRRRCWSQVFAIGDFPQPDPAWMTEFFGLPKMRAEKNSFWAIPRLASPRQRRSRQRGLDTSRKSSYGTSTIPITTIAARERPTWFSVVTGKRSGRRRIWKSPGSLANPRNWPSMCRRSSPTACALRLRHGMARAADYPKSRCSSKAGKNSAPSARTPNRLLPNIAPCDPAKWSDPGSMESTDSGEGEGRLLAGAEWGARLGPRSDCCPRRGARGGPGANRSCYFQRTCEGGRKSASQVARCKNLCLL